MSTRLSREQAEQAVAAVEDANGNVTQAALDLRLARTTLRHRLVVAEREYQLKPKCDDDSEYKTTFKTKTLTDGALSIWSVGDEVRTVEEALSKANLDPAKWIIKEAEVNSYVVPMKMKQPQSVVDLEKPKGKTQALAHMGVKDKRHVVWQVKVKVAPVAGKAILDSLDAIHERAKTYSPSYPAKLKPRYKSILHPHLFEVDVFDAHFGKMCWTEETGNNYDLKIAERIYLNAIDDLLAYAQHFPIERFLLPMGNDFIHIDHYHGTTTRGTPQDFDTRYAKIIQTAFMALVHAIDKMIEVAPVDIILVMGNHDKHASYHIARELASWYRLTDAVDVDYTFRDRKYYRYGDTLLGFTHSDEVRSKFQVLPNLMAQEEPKLWAETKHREWHLGHWHSKAKHERLPMQEVDGVIIRTLSSISGTDAWHYAKGYHSTRAAEGYLWAHNGGYSGHVSVNVRLDD